MAGCLKPKITVKNGIRFERPQVVAPQVWAPHILVAAPRAASLWATLNIWLITPNKTQQNLYQIKP